MAADEKKNDEILKAKKRAMLILQHNDRTEWELTDKLLKAGFSDEAVSEAIEYVRGFHYIDDERYAKRFVEIYHESRSIKRLKQDLYKRHVADEYIELALENIDYDDSTALKRQIEKLGIDVQKASELSYEESQKIVAKLYRKGFSVSSIKNVLSELKKY
ncbi:recombination regulator RecX [Eubacterium sp. MSJ-13]|uniref:regulatory protein RecX n=1 Tax=Eubacterium sp. MSJ-13 TaxID=2841513 RepID=UPI001C0F6128|nr:regulatory protein RecX [Eubacterium sp. MSJ-13]MBU5478850.1 recombination regulator RecX [Eubacterium sp. MSJ-13]